MPNVTRDFELNDIVAYYGLAQPVRVTRRHFETVPTYAVDDAGNLRYGADGQPIVVGQTKRLTTLDVETLDTPATRYRDLPIADFTLVAPQGARFNPDTVRFDARQGWDFRTVLTLMRDLRRIHAQILRFNTTIYGTTDVVAPTPALMPASHRQTPPLSEDGPIQEALTRVNALVRQTVFPYRGLSRENTRVVLDRLAKASGLPFEFCRVTGRVVLATPTVTRCIMWRSAEAARDDNALFANGTPVRPGANCWLSNRGASQFDTFVWSARRGFWVHRDEANGLARIMSYSTNVLQYHQPKMTEAEAKQPVKGARRMFGVELEIETEGRLTNMQRNQLFEEIVETLPCVLKRDGSLPDSTGFEIVTAPATLQYHQEVWPKFFTNPNIIDRLRATDACGMHVHIGRETISPFTLGKMLKWFNTNDRFLSQIAGRPVSGTVRWCRTDSSKGVTAIHREDVAQDKYCALNLAKGPTVEVRIFDSTTVESEFLARLEFAAASVEFCRDHTPQQLTPENFHAYALDPQHRWQWPSLAKWLIATLGQRRRAA